MSSLASSRLCALLPALQGSSVWIGGSVRRRSAGAVGDREFSLEALVLFTQPLVLGAQRLHALTQRCLAGATGSRRCE